MISPVLSAWCCPLQWRGIEWCAGNKGPLRSSALQGTSQEGSARPTARDTWSSYHHHCPKPRASRGQPWVSGASGVSRDQRETLPKKIVCRDTPPVTQRRSWSWVVTLARAPGANRKQNLRCLHLKLLADSESRVSSYTPDITLDLVKSSAIGDSVLRRTGEVMDYFHVVG